MRKDIRFCSTLSYCEQLKAGWGPRNEPSPFNHIVWVAAVILVCLWCTLTKVTKSFELNTCSHTMFTSRPALSTQKAHWLIVLSQPPTYTQPSMSTNTKEIWNLVYSKRYPFWVLNRVSKKIHYWERWIRHAAKCTEHPPPKVSEDSELIDKERLVEPALTLNKYSFSNRFLKRFLTRGLLLSM